MGSSRQLFELQELDSHIDDVGARIADVESRLGENEDLVNARSLLEELQGKLQAVQADEKGLSWETQDLKEAGSKVEATLYGGSVRNPKELKGLEAELGHLQRRQSDGDERLLQLMEESEGLQAQVENATQEFGDTERRWTEEQDALGREHVGLESEIQNLKHDRDRMTGSVDRGVLGLYESIRSTHLGLGVAKVESGVCRGCRISLPNIQLQKVRQGQELVLCNSCGRILFMS